MASNLEAMALAMASNLEAMASNLLAMFLESCHRPHLGVQAYPLPLQRPAATQEACSETSFPVQMTLHMLC